MAHEHQDDDLPHKKPMKPEDIIWLDKFITAQCSGTREWRMCIPVQDDDSDMILCRILNHLKNENQNNPASLSTDSSPVDAHPAIVNQHDAPADAPAGGSPSFRPVILESPYAGDVAANMAYAHNCVRDSLSRGESPYASHIMLTTALDDTDPAQRHTGIHAGFTWAGMADAVVIYTDRGISPGMRTAIRHHQQHGRRIEYRKLKG